jgi:hypothetical protein
VSEADTTIRGALDELARWGPIAAAVVFLIIWLEQLPFLTRLLRARGSQRLRRQTCFHLHQTLSTAPFRIYLPLMGPAGPPAGEKQRGGQPRERAPVAQIKN